MVSAPLLHVSDAKGALIQFDELKKKRDSRQVKKKKREQADRTAIPMEAVALICNSNTRGVLIQSDKGSTFK